MNGQAQTTGPEWRQLLTLGERLTAQPTLAAQLDLILETAAQLVGGDADLWVSEALRRRPGAKPASGAGRSFSFNASRSLAPSSTLT